MDLGRMSFGRITFCTNRIQVEINLGRKDFGKIALSTNWIWAQWILAE
jgi:hypothetical protein